MTLARLIREQVAEFGYKCYFPVESNTSNTWVLCVEVGNHYFELFMHGTIIEISYWNDLLPLRVIDVCNPNALDTLKETLERPFREPEPAYSDMHICDDVKEAWISTT